MRQRHKTPDSFYLKIVEIEDPLTLDISYLSSLGSSFMIEIQTYARTGVPKLFLTMYPFSLSPDEYVPLTFLRQKGWVKSQKSTGFLIELLDF